MKKYLLWLVPALVGAGCASSKKTVYPPEKIVPTEKSRSADISGKLIYDENNEVLFNFGKHAGKMVRNERSYAEWMLKSDFPADTNEVLKKILASRK